MADPTLPEQPIPGQPQPQPDMQPLPQPPQPRPRAARPWMVALVGAVVGALVAAVPLLLTRGGDSGGFGASKDSISAPDLLATYGPVVKNSKANAATIQRITNTETVSGKNLSAAYGGASAVFRQYSDASLGNFFTMEAVRAESPKPFVPYVDPVQLGLAKPDQDVETFGEVSCVVHYMPVRQGQTEPADQVNVVSCERTAAHLTVRLRFGGGDAWHSPSDAAALTDRAWVQLS